MIYNDFRFMRRGKPLLSIKKEDFAILQPINQRSEKKDRALLLFHGFTSSPAVYRDLIPQLTNYDAIVCPVLPGHAESITAFAQTKNSEWVTHATKECEDLFKEYPKVDVLGVSLGALLACKLSMNFQFNHMFLLAPALKLKMNINRNKKLLMLLKNLGFCELRGMMGNILSDKNTEIAYRRIPISTLIELFNLIEEHQWTPPNCPIDLFLGTHDIVVASDEIEKLFAQIPNTTIHWLKNSAHVLPLDNDLDQIVHCVNQCI